MFALYTIRITDIVCIIDCQACTTTETVEVEFM